jgi:hypothetical protein
MPLQRTRRLVHSNSQIGTVLPVEAGWSKGVEEGPLGGRRPEGVTSVPSAATSRSTNAPHAPPVTEQT